jgi:ribosomal protein S18 acetylase RimI-like enzyme
VVVLRSARPTTSDSDSFASLYQMATFNMMQGYLGVHAYRILAQIFPLPRHEHSYDLTTFAIEDGVPVGLLTGYTTTTHEEVGLRTMMLYARFGFLGLLRGVPMILRMRPLSAVTGKMPPNAYYIKAMAVDPAHRRKGIAAQLMTHADELARQAGCTQMVLDVRTMNEGAIAFYEACGYRKTAQTPDITYNGDVYGFFRMEKML